MGVAPEIYHGPSGAFERDSILIVDAPSGQMDRIEQDWDVPWPLWKAALTVAGITKGSAYPGYTQIYVEGFGRIVQDSQTRGIVSVIAMGLLDATNNKRRRRMSAFGRRTGVPNNRYAVGVGGAVEYK